jgi:hypothetical protein
MVQVTADYHPILARSLSHLYTEWQPRRRFAYDVHHEFQRHQGRVSSLADPDLLLLCWSF